jgi:hypothetical protein
MKKNKIIKLSTASDQLLVVALEGVQELGHLLLRGSHIPAGEKPTTQYIIKA